MISTLLHVALTNLRRDRVLQVMVFLLPIVFFSIFAFVFGEQGRGPTARVEVAVVDEDRSPWSARLLAALEREPGLQLRTTLAPAGTRTRPTDPPLDRKGALGLVRNGDLAVAIVIPEGLDAASEDADRASIPIQILADTADTIAPQIVSGLLQQVFMTLLPPWAPASPGLGEGGPPSDLRDPQARGPRGSPGGAALGRPAALSSAPPAPEGLLRVQIVDVLGEKKSNPTIAFYAGGIAVMFLLFNAAGAGGALLDEVDSGTLDRLLTANAGMGTVLLGKWLFITVTGIAQITVMFAWGMLVFDLDLLHHLPGFAVITSFTAASAAGMGLVLATLCRSRQQLSGISTLLILTQSALGGSMFPRFLMSDTLQSLSLFTFNAWALDGYLKVFWRDAPLRELWPQLAVLAALTVVFLALARVLAKRWETR